MSALALIIGIGLGCLLAFLIIWWVKGDIG